MLNSDAKIQRMRLTGVVVDKTKAQDVAVESARDRIEKQAEETWSGMNADRSHAYTMDVQLDVGREPKKGDHIIMIVDDDTPDLDGGQGQIDRIGGMTIRLKKGLLQKTPETAMPGEASFERTAAHEIGHAGHLYHPGGPVEKGDKNPVQLHPNDNVMHQTLTKGKDVPPTALKSTSFQAREIQSRVDRGQVNLEPRKDDE